MTQEYNQDIEKMNFEAAFNALQANVDALESQELPLEEALALFARGQQLAKRCTALLEKAEMKVTALSEENESPNPTDERIHAAD